MIRITYDGGVSCEVDVRDRLPVYLDNDCIIEIAKGPEPRRARFINALRKRGTLLFSLTNAAEVAGPKGASAAAVRAFLDSAGACWAPLELNPWNVVKKEEAGEWQRAPISERFVISYFQERAYEQSPGGERILNLNADDFFRLSAIVDWSQEPDADVTAQAVAMDFSLADTVRQARAEFDRDPGTLDRRWRPIPFDPRRSTTFALVHLLRLLVFEAKARQLKKNDGLDFCHAVMAASTAGIATLDKHWKGRVERLPKPHQLAKLFYRPEVDEMVRLFESAVEELISTER